MGSWRRVRVGNANDVLVLCYHSVSPRWPIDITVTPDALARQLESLVQQGYRGATFQEAASSATGKVLAVTFDDAYHSVLEHAYPIMRALGLPGTVFAVTDYVTHERPLWWPGMDDWQESELHGELRGLTWDELRLLADAGWEIGSHTATHPLLTELDDAELAGELERSKAACEHELDRECRTVAYPYNNVDRRVAAAAAEAGYAAGAAIRRSVGPPRVLSWPRVGVYRLDSYLRFRLKVSPLVRRMFRASGPRKNYD
jgi:peptidoglycan/xylan/chitin deacetylase (PgdA/CDA1 family)